MSYYKYATYGIVALGAGVSVFSGCYIMSLETVFDHLKDQVLDPNANDSEWEKLNKNIKSGGGDGTDRLSSFTRESLKSKTENYNSLRDGCRIQYRSTFKSGFKSINPNRMLEVRSVCVMTKDKSSLTHESSKTANKLESKNK